MAGSDGKESACNAGDTGSIPRSGRSSGKGNGNPLQYSGLKSPMDRGTWQANSPQGLKESDMNEQPMQCTVYRDTEESNSVTGFYFIGRERRKTMTNHNIYLKLQTQE